MLLSNTGHPAGHWSYSTNVQRSPRSVGQQLAGPGTTAAEATVLLGEWIKALHYGEETGRLDRQCCCSSDRSAAHTCMLAAWQKRDIGLGT